MAGAALDAAVLRRPALLRVWPARVHYGWAIVAGAALLYLVTVGLAYYGMAVFLRPLQEEHGWSNAAVSGATGMFFVVAGLSGVWLGPRVDRGQGGRLLVVGVVGIGLSLSTVGIVNELWQLYTAYAVIAVVYSLAVINVQAMLARWFLTRRAQALSLTSTGVSLGGAFTAPVGSALIDRGGVQLAALVLAAAMVVIGVPVVLGVFADAPGDVGAEPDFGAPQRVADAEAMTDAVQRRVWTRREASRTVAFWAVLGGFVLVLLAQTGVLLHQIAFLEDRLGSRRAAAFALTTTTIGSIVARLVVGRFADRVEKRHVAVVLFTVQASAVLGLVFVDGRAATYALVLVFGFTIGNVYLMQSLLVGEIFGLVSIGTIMGLIQLATQIGSGVGPLLVGSLEDLTGSYQVPFVVTSLLTYAAAVAILFARRPASPANRR